MKGLLSVENVSYTWTYRGGTAEALYSMSAEFASGVPHIICGASGSGKTTLALLLAGLLPVKEGRVYLDRQPIAKCCSDIAYIFQFPETIFFEDSIALELQQIAGTDSLTRAAEYLRQLGITYRDFAEKHPYHLSEGYGRLIASVLQLARETPVLISDEPTIGLDWDHQARMTGLLKNWLTPERILIVITHDLDLMRDLGGRAWVLSDGRLVWKGQTDDLLADEKLLEAYSLAY